MDSETAKGLALFGALASAFEGSHPFCDQWAQLPQDAMNKGLHGKYLVYRDGTPIGIEPRPGASVLTANALGWQSAARHVAMYTAVQLVATVGVTRAAGYLVPIRALLAGAAVNGLTHLIIDRREPLKRLAKPFKKAGYIERATVVRKPGKQADEGGPGTALMELDQSLHRGIGLVAAAVTTWLVMRQGR
jgi:hypothetical protein